MWTYTSAKNMRFFENFRRCAIFDARVADFQPAETAFKTVVCGLYDYEETVKIMRKKKAAFRVRSKYIIILANYDLFLAIFLGKITNTWATIVSISKNTRLSNIHNQLMTKYTKLRKSRDVFSFS